MRIGGSDGNHDATEATQVPLTSNYIAERSRVRSHNRAHSESLELPLVLRMSSVFTVVGLEFVIRPSWPMAAAIL